MCDCTQCLPLADEMWARVKLPNPAIDVITHLNEGDAFREIIFNIGYGSQQLSKAMPYMFVFAADDNGDYQLYVLKTFQEPFTVTVSGTIYGTEPVSEEIYIRLFGRRKRKTHA